MTSMQCNDDLFTDIITDIFQTLVRFTRSTPSWPKPFLSSTTTNATIQNSGKPKMALFNGVFFLQWKHSINFAKPIMGYIKTIHSVTLAKFFIYIQAVDESTTSSGTPTQWQPTARRDSFPGLQVRSTFSNQLNRTLFRKRSNKLFVIIKWRFFPRRN